MQGAKTVTTQRPVERAFLVGTEIEGEQNPWIVDDSLQELGQLASTAGAEVVGALSQKLKTPNPRHFIGSGKVEQLQQLRRELSFDMVIFDDDLTPSQQRNLEQQLGVKVIDRAGLILDVFAQRAHTREGRLQVELAQYEYLLPRLTGQWTHLSRQFGGVGARGGPGETQLEVDRRRVRQRIRDLRNEIERVRRHRALYRKQREAEGVLVVALVGYTNAGKSTLLNALTDAEVTAEDRLFDTLDPTTRRLKLPGGKQVLISDTVGFIQKLPPTIVAAFRATLEELESADVLVHVLDITHPSGYEQSLTVGKILADLHLAEKPVVTALNKVDKLVPDIDRGIATSHSNYRDLLQDARAPLEELVASYPNGVAVSAMYGWGFEELLNRIQLVLDETLVDVRLKIPYCEGELVAAFHEKGSISKRSYTKDGVMIAGRVPQKLLSKFARYAIEG